MKIFNGIPPNAGHQSIQQGFRAVIEHARQVVNGRAEWALFEAGLDAEDRQWLYDWAKNLQPEVVRYWLHNGPSPDNAEAQAKYAAAFGILLTLLTVDSARVGLPQANDWPLPIDFTFNATARATLFDGEDPLPEQVRAIQLAIEKLRLKRGFSTNPKQWLRETIALQINPADEPKEDLPRWIPETIASVEEHRRTQAPAPRDHVSINDIFGQIEVRVGAATIEEAARAMLDRARDKGFLSGPWSMAELEPTDYDYIWLRVWIKELDANTVNYCNNESNRFSWAGRKYPFQAAFGLLLMLWISECARREAEEGWLWRWVPKEAINDKAARRSLFAQDRPSSVLKELLEISARRFNLRHVFGRVGAQQWIDTIFLQFGFTRRGFERRLTEWVAGQSPTQAVKSLLDPETGSASFRDLWEALRNYRQNNITRAQALSKTQIGGWLLPEWIERALELATAPLDGGADAEDTTQSAEPEAGDSFLTEPLLRWNPPDAPYFACRLVYLDALGLTEDGYDVTVNDRLQTQLLRRADGGYAAADGDEIRIPFGAGRAIVKVIGSEGQVIAAEDVELWPAGEDVVIFQLSTGRRLSDPYRHPMYTQASYAALTAPDLRLEPQPAYCYSGARIKLFYLSGNWSRETRVWLEDDVLWEPFFQQRSATSDPPWMAQVHLSVDSPSSSLRWGDRIHLKVMHPSDVTVSFARYSGGPLEFAPQNGQYTRVGPLRLSPESGAGALQLQLGLKRHNQLYRVKQETIANITGVAKRENGSWKPLDERFVLRSEAARSAQFKIAPPHKWDGEDRAISDWALMEGELWLKNLSRNQAPIGDVAGLGAPMTLRLGPYNSDRNAMTVARAVIDCGVIEEALETDGELHLRLSQPIEPSDRHRVVYWDVNGQIHELQPRAQENAPHNLWRCPAPDGAPDYLAVALMYEGWRLGARWPDDWHMHIEQSAEANPKQTAMMLRWFRLPLLDEKALNDVRAIAERHVAEFLPAWLQEGDFPPFNLPDLTDGWLAAVRTIYHGWTPGPEDANRFINALCERESFQRAFWRLLKVDPRLLYKTLKSWLSIQPDQRMSVKALRLLIADAGDEEQFDDQRRLLLEEGAREWRRDTYFIENGIINRAVAAVNGQRLQPRDEMNIALALSSESLRRLLAMSLLKSIA
jgi:hypothetical protein